MEYSPNLLEWLRCLSTFKQCHVVIVPGGGRFADEVRRSQQHWNYCDGIAHQMALLAMHQYGLMMAGIHQPVKIVTNLDDLSRPDSPGQLTVWGVSKKQLEGSALPHSWSVTSDSLALWLAREIKADHLVLVKSVTMENCSGRSSVLADLGVIDEYFVRLLPSAKLDVRICYQNDHHHLSETLEQSAKNWIRISN